MDIERARFNMVEQQIRPWDVLDQDILDLLFVLKREEFVPPAYRAMAFTDMELPLNVGDARTGEVMFAPRMEARLLQELALKPNESVLEIGAGSGYMAALMSHRAERVLSLELRPELATFARLNLARAGIGNARVECADGSKVGVPGKIPGDFNDTASWDVIVLSGSVPFIPDDILARLRPGGRALAIVGEQPVMTARIVTRVDGGGTPRFDAVDLFETIEPPLANFPKRDAFRF